MKISGIVFLLSLSFSAFAQHENKNWYFGYNIDGIIFNNNIPVKVNNKYPGVGYEGIVVVSEPNTGNLIFYSDGIKVIDKNHTIMTNGTGLTGNLSGAQSVQCCPVPGTCMQQYYLFTNSAYDNTSGDFSYSIIDFTSNPLGVVTNKNTPFWAGPSDQGFCLVNKPNSNDYWLIANTYSTATYYVWQVNALGISAPVVYSFANTGSSYQMNYSEAAQKIVVTGWGNKHVTTIDFDATTGILSNEVQVAPISFGFCGGARFSPDGSKLYVGVNPPTTNLFQYDYNTTTWTNMNTCCYAHDLKMGPDGKMYFIHTYNSAQPIGVIDYPDSSAVGNICNYHPLTFVPVFNGQVRRFPEFLTFPAPPVALEDSFTVNVSVAVNMDIMINDIDPQGDSLLFDSILTGPFFGNTIISGSQIIYTADSGTCGMTDTIIYRIKDVNCSYDTATVIIHIACNQALIALASSDTTFCEKHCIDFYDMSTNSPTSWQWFFPGADSTSSTLQNPTNICYNSYGSFDVTLIACNAAGCDTLLISNFITEYQAPVSVITQSNDTLYSSPGFAYQWYSISSGLIAGANNSFLIASLSGSYYVIVTDSNGCEGASNVIVITGINQLANDNFQFDIFPNPNNGTFEIVFSNEHLAKNTELRILNALGEVVFQAIICNFQTTFSNSIVPGIYFLELKTENSVYRKKVVVKN